MLEYNKVTTNVERVLSILKCKHKRFSLCFLRHHIAFENLYLKLNIQHHFVTPAMLVK